MNRTKAFGVQGFPLRRRGHGWPALDSRGGIRAPGGDCCEGRCNDPPECHAHHGEPLFYALQKKELPGNNRFEGLYIMRITIRSLPRMPLHCAAPAVSPTLDSPLWFPSCIPLCPRPRPPPIHGRRDGR